MSRRVTPIWTNKVVVISGGSAGLGKAMVADFVQQGARVAILARNVERLAAVADSFGAGNQVLPCRCDVTQEVDVQQSFATILERWGRLDLVANVAGVSARGMIAKTSAERLRGMMELNFFGGVHCALAAIPALVESSGSLVFVGSLAGKIAGPYLGGYPATKFAVAGYAQQARLELSPGVHVLLVSPGPIRRDDPAPRHAATTDIPMSAAGPGGGVRIQGIDPDWLANRIRRACERREPELVVPVRARWLAALCQLFPAWGDRIVRRMMR